MSEEERLVEQLFAGEKLTDKQKKIILAAIENLFPKKAIPPPQQVKLQKKQG